MTLTEALSELAIETPGIPDPAERAAQKMTLDALGCALAVLGETGRDRH